MKQAPVNNIIPFSNVDGPGNRTSIFFQGCPFQCVFCHNPETINPCIHCGVCVNHCPSGSLTFENGKVVWNKSTCVQCDTCIKVCPHLSSPKITWMNVQEVVDQLKIYSPFIRGITVSGGECMLRADFLGDLFYEVKKQLQKDCLIDSNGFYDFSQYPHVLENSLGVMLDVKASDEKFHLKIMKADNKMVLKNLEYLQSVDKLFEVRTVIYPNFEEENEKTVRSVCERLAPHIRYKLIKYRPFGVREEGLKIFGNQIASDEEINRLIHIAEKEYGMKNMVII